MQKILPACRCFTMDFCNGNGIKAAADGKLQRGMFAVEDGTEVPLPNLKFPIPCCYQGDLQSVLIPREIVHERIKYLAQAIHARIGDQPLTMVCILKGSYRFFTALVDCLAEARSDCKSHIQVEFVRAQSYLDQSSSGEVTIQGLASIDDSLAGRNVVLVDDIADTGLTLSRLVAAIGQKVGSTGRVWTAVLLSKRTAQRRADALNEDFVAFSIPDKFVVGFGLDYNQMFRDLAHICVMSETGIQKYCCSG